MTDNLPKASQVPALKPKLKIKKPLIIVAIIFLLFVGILAGVGWYSYQAVKDVRFATSQLELTTRAVADQAKTQNLAGVKAEMEKLPGKIEALEKELNQLAFFGSLPLAKTYWQDVQHLLKATKSGLAAGQKAVVAVEPYADVLGLSGDQNPALTANAENRIKLILETLDKTLPEIDAIAQDLQTASQELSAIDPQRYPERIGDNKVRSQLITVQQIAQATVLGLTEFKPVIEQIPSIAGAQGERKKYLILFQNDNELRPTGGFLTAYSVIFIEDGKVVPDYSDDIYELDKKFRSKIPIPKELGKYLTTEKYWNLRDMNTSPDFKLSMDQFYTHYQKVGDKDLDGIIAVDTEVLTALLNIVGPVAVPGYGTFTAEITPKCDCPQVVYALSEIITRPTPYLREDRKGILGPFMREVLTKVYDAPSDKNAALFQAGLEALNGRHVQTYFIDQKNQLAVEKINLAGRLNPSSSKADTDFFALINANLGGAKSNLFVTYDVKQEVTQKSEGVIEKTVEIIYKNDRRADNCNLEAGLLCLNATLRDWTRIYVPKGSKLIEASGFLATPTTYEENELTVFDGFFTLEPNAAAKLKLTYQVPYLDQNTYRLQIWKQGGISSFPLVLDVNGDQQQLEIDKDTTLQINF